MICDFEIKIFYKEFKISKLNINLDCVNFWTMNEIYIESGFYIEMGKLICDSQYIFGKTYWNINILGINWVFWNSIKVITEFH